MLIPIETVKDALAEQERRAGGIINENRREGMLAAIAGIRNAIEKEERAVKRARLHVVEAVR